MKPPVEAPASRTSHAHDVDAEIRERGRELLPAPRHEAPALAKLELGFPLLHLLACLGMALHAAGEHGPALGARLGQPALDEQRVQALLGAHGESVPRRPPGQSVTDLRTKERDGVDHPTQRDVAGIGWSEAASAASSTTSPLTRALARAGVVRDARREVDRLAEVVAVARATMVPAWMPARAGGRPSGSATATSWSAHATADPRVREVEHDAVAQELHDLAAVLRRRAANERDQPGRELDGRVVAGFLGHARVATEVEEDDRRPPCRPLLRVPGLPKDRLELLDRRLEGERLEMPVVDPVAKLLARGAHPHRDRPDRLEHLPPRDAPGPHGIHDVLPEEADLGERKPRTFWPRNRVAATSVSGSSPPASRTSARPRSARASSSRGR